jgi:plasmid replication initiation protein
VVPVSRRHPTVRDRIRKISHVHYTHDVPAALSAHSLAKTHRTTPIDYRVNDVAIRVEAVPEHGMATIWDADVLIWAASQYATGARA